MPDPRNPAAVRLGEAELTAAFRKDQADEAFLAQLNAALAGLEEAGYRDLPEERPTLHVIGTPRSGTTLLYQLIASGLEVGFVSNLVAAFWRAPATGLRLARMLRLQQLESEYRSEFGRTHGISEPHEFGYFWNHHLSYPDLRERGPDHGESVDWERLARVIRNMADVAGRPMIFKPMLLIWHLEQMVEAMPRTCYAWIRRDRRATALSLLKMRRTVFGSDEAWASLQPAGPLEDEPPWRQVAAQVVLLERTIAVAAERLGSERMLELSYEEVCSEPAATLGRIADLMAAHGERPQLLTPTLPSFAPHVDQELEAEYGDRVGEAIAYYEDLYP